MPPKSGTNKYHPEPMPPEVLAKVRKFEGALEASHLLLIDQLKEEKGKKKKDVFAFEVLFRMQLITADLFEDLCKVLGVEYQSGMTNSDIRRLIFERQPRN